MDYNRPALLVILALYFIFITIGMTWYGQALQDFSIDSEYTLKGVTYDNETELESVSQGSGVSLIKDLRVSVTNIPYWISIIMFGLPAILLVLVLVSFFTAD